MQFCRFILFLSSLLALSTSQAGTEGRPLVPQEFQMTVEGRDLKLTFVIFSARDFSVRVIDNAAANDTGKYARLRFAAKALGASAGCNGGFFERNPFTPFGFMIADRVRAGTFDPHSWLAGVLVVRARGPSLEDAALFQDSPAVIHLLQSGPWLVRASQPLASSDTRRAARTFICRGPDATWALGVSSACTLGQLAAALKSKTVAATLEVQDALNFDGGPSTGLWVKGAAEDYSVPEQWTVRNYVAIFPGNASEPAR